MYKTAEGNEPLTDWLNKLKDQRDRSRIIRRINRIEQGNFGDHRHIVGGEGVSELRLNFGPGYRVYFAEDGPVVVLLLCAGSKKSQRSDIRKALALWQDYKTRQNHD